MIVCASNENTGPPSSATMSLQPSSGGWRSYHVNVAVPSITPVATNTVARNPCRSSTGSACSATSR